MKLLSINVGLPREVDWRGETVRTSIFKTPVAGQVRVTTLNVEGDRQSDLSVHGGSDKAVYAYPSEHYAFWRTELPGTDLPWGVFGENLTTEGLWNIISRLAIASAPVLLNSSSLNCECLVLSSVFALADPIWSSDFSVAAGPAFISRFFKRETSPPVTRLKSSLGRRTGSQWLILPTCSWQVRRIKSSFAAQANYRHCRRAGGITSASGSRTRVVDRRSSRGLPNPTRAGLGTGPR